MTTNKGTTQAAGTTTSSPQQAATTTTGTRAARRRRRSTLRMVSSSVWLVLAFSALALAGYQVASGKWHATPVLSGSMRPGLQPGDVVVTQRVPITDLRVRDVVVFHPPAGGDRLTVHRIVKIAVSRGTTSITSWGDANAVADSAVSSLSGSTAYRVVRVIPLVGYPAVWLQNGNHGALAIALGVILLGAAAMTLLRPERATTRSDSTDAGDAPGSPNSPGSDSPGSPDPPGSIDPKTTSTRSLEQPHRSQKIR